VWYDEFEGDSLNPLHWTIGQEWDQDDCDYPEVASVNGKTLVEVSDGTLRLQSWNEPSGGKPYAGAVVKTRQSGSDPPLFSFQYGYLEVRVKRTAIGQGFHMNCYTFAYDESTLPSSSQGGHVWPSEIDFAETLSREYYRDRILNALHIDKGSGHIKEENWVEGIDWSQWHTYAFHWKETGYVDFYIDGNLTYSTTERLLPDLPQYLLLRIGVGGWIGAPDEFTEFPGIQEVDWVRYYRPVVTHEISLASPVSGEIFPVSTPIDLESDVTTHSDTAEYVVYYMDDTPVDTVHSAPFIGSAVIDSVGRYDVSAAVYDSKGRHYRSDPVPITVGDVDSNLIFSGGFEESLKPWELITSGGAAAGALLSDLDPLSEERSVKIEITDPTTDLMNIILRQKMYFEKDQTYRLSLLARAESDRKMAINVHRVSPYDSYLFERINLTEEKTLYSYRFKASDSTYRGRVDLYLGGNSAAVWIDSVFLTPAAPVGFISPASDASSMELYPNPASDYVNIRFSGKVDFSSGLRLMDETGRILMNIPYREITGNRFRLDLSGLPAGIYFLSCKRDGKQLTEKIVHF
jgi:beta-glucanase (GH16 family)